MAGFSIKTAGTGSYVLILLGLLLSGCIYVPLPPSVVDSCHQHIFEDPSSEISIGSTSRAEILLMLGEPDYSYRDDRLFVYINRQGRSGTGVLVSNVGLAGYDRFTLHRLFVTFDQQGIVASSSYEAVPCSPPITEQPEQCFDPRGKKAFLQLAHQGIRTAWIGSVFWQKGESKWWQQEFTPGWLVVGEESLDFYLSDGDFKETPSWQVYYSELSAIEPHSFLGEVYSFQLSLKKSRHGHRVRLEHAAMDSPDRTLKEIVDFVNDRIGESVDVEASH